MYAIRERRLYAIWVLIALILGACVSLESPKTFNERLAYGYASVAASRNTAAALLERGRISVAEAKDAQDKADKARTALDLARGTQITGDIKTAEGQLNTALTILTQLEAYLKGRE